MYNKPINISLLIFSLFIYGCGDSSDYSGLIFYDTKSSTSSLPGNNLNHGIHIGRNEHGKIYFITIYDEFSIDYSSKIILKLDRDTSVRKGFISLTVTTDLDKLIIYPKTKRDPHFIDLLREVKGKIIIDKIDPIVAEGLILKYSK